MKSPSIKTLVITSVSATIIFLLASCVKDKFNSPTITNADPSGMHATMTIRQFKNLYCGGTRGDARDSINPVIIKDTIILSGIINGDDRSGNIYKTLIFQDTTGGLQIVADQSDLYNTYPVGTRIFVKCIGLYIYNYLGTLEIGSYINRTGSQPSLGGIPSVNIPTYVVKGQTGLTVAPKHWTLSSLANTYDLLNDQNTLIQIDSVQFINADTSMTYADAINKASGNLIPGDSTTYYSNVTVRSSGYSDFATQKPSKGFGSLLGILTFYITSSTTNQITIRDTSDVQFYSPRRH